MCVFFHFFHCRSFIVFLSSAQYFRVFYRIFTWLLETFFPVLCFRGISIHAVHTNTLTFCNFYTHFRYIYIHYSMFYTRISVKLKTFAITFSFRSVVFLYLYFLFLCFVFVSRRLLLSFQNTHTSIDRLSIWLWLHNAQFSNKDISMSLGILLTKKVFFFYF